MKNRKRITLQEIADLAGVSLTTASMCLNGKAKKYNLADATCKRIEEIIREKHYVPNFHARAIASKKTFLVGVMISYSLDTSFWLTILSALEKTLSLKNYHMLLSVAGAEPERQLESIRYMENIGVDGIIINPVPGTENDIRKLAEKLPVVTMNTRIPGVSCAWNDDELGGRIAAEAVIKAGHTKIAYIRSPEYESPRIEAYCSVMKEHGLKPVLFPDIQEFLKQRKKFTAAVCYSDFVILAMYHAASEEGFRIPDDLSVIGYDNMSFVDFLSPAPATVNQYKEEIGTAAADALLSLISAENHGVIEHRFEPVLVQGKTIRNLNRKYRR